MPLNPSNNGKMAWPLEINLSRRIAGQSIWQQCGHLFFAGKAFYKGKVLSLEELESGLRTARCAEEVRQILRQLNGSFALAYKSATTSVAAVDVVRSIPLFYGNLTSGGAIFDQNPIALTTRDGLKLLHAYWPKIEFLPDTLTATPRHALLPGEFVFQERPKPAQRHRYYLHSLSPGNDHYQHYFEHFAATIDRMQHRLVTLLAGRTAVVPLSGGFDSRFILAMLHKAGYPSVQAYTYGRPDGHEQHVAHRVAAQLDIPWRFIPYDEQLLASAAEDDFLHFFHFASNAQALAQEQDYFALKALKSSLPTDAVFLPGFCGDLQAGSYLPDQFYRKKWEKKPELAASYCANRLARFEEVPKAFPGYLWQATGHYEAFYGLLERWMIEEKVSKYVVNAVRAFEYFGFQWLLPLWDREFVDFWKQVPLAYRRDKRLYRDVLNTVLFHPLNIGFAPGGFDQHFQSGNTATRLRYLLPRPLKSALKSMLIPKQEHQINNLNMLEPILLGQRQGLPVNEVMARWYLKHLDNLKA